MKEIMKCEKNLNGYLCWIPETGEVYACLKKRKAAEKFCKNINEMILIGKLKGIVKRKKF